MGARCPASFAASSSSSHSGLWQRLHLSLSWVSDRVTSKANKSLRTHSHEKHARRHAAASETHRNISEEIFAFSCFSSTTIVCSPSLLSCRW